jgi:hypothetical protein
MPVVHVVQRNVKERIADTPLSYSNQYILWLFSEIFTNREVLESQEIPPFSLFLFPFWEFFSVSFYTPTTMKTGPHCRPL